MSLVEALSASLEDYLETIYHLVQEGRVARVKDIAARMSVQMPSVTGALRALGAKDLVNHDPYSYVTLTPRGEAVAREMVRRHEVLTDFLSEFLGLDRETAERNACHMEHAIEAVVLDRLIGFVEFARQCPRAGAKWVRGMAHVCQEGERFLHCVECIKNCLAEVRAQHAATSSDVGLVPLSELGQGKRGNVGRIETGEDLAAKFQENGLTPGALVEVEGAEPDGGVQVQVRGCRLSLTPQEASAILVKRS